MVKLTHKKFSCKNKSSVKTNKIQAGGNLKAAQSIGNLNTQKKTSHNTTIQNEIMRMSDRQRHRFEAEKKLHKVKKQNNLASNEKLYKNQKNFESRISFNKKTSFFRNVKNTFKTLFHKSLINPDRTDEPLLSEWFIKGRGFSDNKRFFKLFNDAIYYYRKDFTNDKLIYMGNIPINTIKQATVYFYNYIPELTIITSKKTYYLSRISFENKEDSFENTQDDMIKILSKWEEKINELKLSNN